MFSLYPRFHSFRISFATSQLLRRHYSLPPNFTISSTVLEKNSNKKSKESFDLNPKDIANTLEYDPNLTYFYDTETLSDIEKLKNGSENDQEEINDPFDLSNIQVTKLDSSSLSTLSPDVLSEPKTMSTEDFIKMMSSAPSNPLSIDDKSDVEIPSTDTYLSEMVQNVNPQLSSNSIREKPDSPILNFLVKDDIPSTSKMPKHISLNNILTTELPLVIVSRLTDPRINLSIEKFIYDTYPNPKDPLNKFAKRLFLYKNSNCIVLGKNQNIFKEVNLHLASTYSIPILRRFSGGGTVVHDLGNYNFSFMCSKDEFSRTAFTTEFIKYWNDYLLTNPNVSSFELDINEKGDMIRKSDQKKISGSAFQISKGKSLHHGTMLLNSDLKTLSKLLKIDSDRLSSITDRATDSIPSPVINTNMDENSFLEICIQSFVNKFGVPTNLSNKINNMKVDNLDLVRENNIECQILKIDNLTDLPLEIRETYEQLKDWNWIFGKSPKFQMEFTLDNGLLTMKFEINQGKVISLEYDKFDPNDTRLDGLITAISINDPVIYFSSPSISKYISDPKLKKEIAWRIDQCLDYMNIGIQHPQLEL